VPQWDRRFAEHGIDAGPGDGTYQVLIEPDCGAELRHLDYRS
jgi:hypothetical protein